MRVVYAIISYGQIFLLGLYCAGQFRFGSPVPLENWITTGILLVASTTLDRCQKHRTS